MKKQSGFVALSTVLVLSAIFLSLAVTIASRAISGSTAATVLQLRYSAMEGSNACAEHALSKLIATTSYSGNESILVGAGTCSILPIQGSGNVSRIVETVSTVSDYIYRTRVVVEAVSPLMKITSWESVVDF